MKKHYRYFIGGMATVLIPVGAFFLVIFALAAALEAIFATDGKSDVTILTENPSPRHKYIATTFSSLGGGAAGWCSAKVNVRSSNEAFDQNESVFGAHCGTEIKTEWENDDTLRVSYSTGEEMIGITQKRWSADKTFKIIYIGKQPIFRTRFLRL